MHGDGVGAPDSAHSPRLHVRLLPRHEQAPRLPLPCFFSFRSIYTATGSNLAVFLATTFANETAGGVQLLFRVAKRGLLEEELSGVPKVCVREGCIGIALPFALQIHTPVPALYGTRHASA